MTAVRVPRPSVPGGYAPLDSGLLVPRANLPAASVAGRGACPQLSGNVVDALRGDGQWSAPGSPQRGVFVSTDMWNAGSGVAPWFETTVSSGSRKSAGVDDSEHPGVLCAMCGTVANGGFAWSLAYNRLMLGGRESTDIIWRVPSGGSDGTTIHLGLHDSISVSEPIDGCYVSVVGTTLTGYCASNSTRTASAPYTISEGPWYRLHVEAAAALASASYALYTCADGALVWSATIDSNLPVGRSLSHGVVATNGGTTAKELLDVDYVSLVINRALVR